MGLAPTPGRGALGRTQEAHPHLTQSHPQCQHLAKKEGGGLPDGWDFPTNVKGRELGVTPCRARVGGTLR